MERIAKFEKVSFGEFKSSLINTLKRDDLTDELIMLTYNSIEWPTRSTKGSAGYDFKSYCWFKLAPNQSITIPTGIRANIDDGWALFILPRSSYGFKYRLQLDNSVALIDADYYYSDNEGHIMIKLTNDSKSNKTLTVNPGDKFVQGVFLPFGITTNDHVEAIRNGGIGSTDGK